MKQSLLCDCSNNTSNNYREYTLNIKNFTKAYPAWYFVSPKLSTYSIIKLEEK